ncbi:MAG: YraN family protein [Fibrobacter sp.]|nr:YraN family protein [Fibrobacter sp.]
MVKTYQKNFAKKNNVNEKIFGTRVKGNYIETHAAAYLRRCGYEILARNYAYRGGELDIVAKDGETIVFVEVKSVWNNQQGNPAARVNREKQKKIWRTACHFLQANRSMAPKGFDQPCRFDVLSARVYQQPLQFSHLQNAFEGDQVIPQC